MVENIGSLYEHVCSMSVGSFLEEAHRRGLSLDSLNYLTRRVAGSSGVDPCPVLDPNSEVAIYLFERLLKDSYFVKSFFRGRLPRSTSDEVLLSEVYRKLGGLLMRESDRISSCSAGEEVVSQEKIDCLEKRLRKVEKALEKIFR